MTYRGRSRRVNPVVPASQTLVEQGQVVEPAVEQTETMDQGYARIRVVRILCTLISGICALFAAVLAIHILLVLGSANPANGFAHLIAGWANAITLGLTDLFRPGNPKIQVLLNQGLAAILWLAVGAALTTVLARIALPEPARRIRYRRIVR